MESPSRRALLSAIATGIGAISGCTRTGSDGTRTATTKQTTRTVRTTQSTTTSTQTTAETATETTAETTRPPPQNFQCDRQWEPTVRWSIDTHVRAYAPTVFDGTVYFGSQNGHLYAVDAETGRIKWWVNHGGVQKAPTVDEMGTVVVTGADETAAYDATTGRKQWSFVPPGDHARLADWYGDDGETVYVGASQQPGVEYTVDDRYARVYALNRETGERRWQRSLMPRGKVKRLVFDSVGGSEAFVFTISRDNLLITLDATDGTELWRRDIGGNADFPVVGNGTVFLDVDHTLLALEGRSGVVKWKRETEQPPGISHDVVYGPEDGVLRAFDETTGRVQWAAEIPEGGCGGTPVRSGDIVYLPTSCLGKSGRLYAFDANQGCYLGYFGVRSANLSTPAITDSMVYMGGLNGQGRMWAISIP